MYYIHAHIYITYIYIYHMCMYIYIYTCISVSENGGTPPNNHCHRNTEGLRSSGLVKARPVRLQTTH